MTLSEPVATVKWPNVPACYGWLSLDRRGCWRLKGEVIRHTGLISFINSHYSADGAGNWVFQNGPQAVFVGLDYTPLVLRLEADGGLTAHTGAPAGPVKGAYLDEEGNVLLDTAMGIGLLDDRDLAEFLDACRDAVGAPAADEAVLAAISGDRPLFWRGIPLQNIRQCDVACRFGFHGQPVP